VCADIRPQSLYLERSGRWRGEAPAADAVSDSTLSLPRSAARALEAADSVIEAPMMSLADNRVLFVATAGSRRGTGYVARCLSIARALGVRPLVAVPGPRSAADLALALGADVIADATPAVINALQSDLVVVDDPEAAQMGGWIIAAQRAGALVVTSEDLGLQTPTHSEARHSRPTFVSEGRRDRTFGAHQ
jgi:hypothetical protein